MDISINISNTVIKTKRLTLRPLRENDTIEPFRGMQEKKENESLTANKSVFAITVKGDNREIIGLIRICQSWLNECKPYKKTKAKAIDCIFWDENYKKSFLTEAATAVTEYCFEELWLDALTTSRSNDADFSNKSEMREIKLGCNANEFTSQLDQTPANKEYVLINPILLNNLYLYFYGEAGIKNKQNFCF